MKVIVDIKNKTLKMLENERSIFKGEYSADKLELYINKQLENEYPVITGLLSNGRRIGAFTTDDGYEVETIDGVEYTKAKFTLSKENGFPLSAGATQVTIWMYRTKDSVLVSKEAIGNVVFTVVDTTAFNDGDIIISGDVEGTVVNLKVEMENLQAKTEQYLPLNGGKPMTGDLKMKDKHIIFNKEEDNMKIGYDENDAKMSIDMQNSDYYKAQYHASGFRVGNNAIEANLDVEESKFEFSLGNNISKITPDGFSVSKEGTSTSYDDGRITRYIDNYSKYVEIKLPNESGTIATIDDIPTKVSQLDNDSGLITNAVDDLTNYYLKSETYTKSEVQQLLSTISGLKLEVVTNLPTTNISSNTIYLKSLDSTKENNIYEEYIYVNSKWETIGTTAVDLTNYALKEDIPTKISELEQDVELGVSEEDVMDIIENNAEQTNTLDVGTSTNYNPNSDTQIPTTKAVQAMINVGGGSGSGSGNYLPLSGGTMSGNIIMPQYTGLKSDWSDLNTGFGFLDDGSPVIVGRGERGVYVASDEFDGNGLRYTFPEYNGEVLVKDEDGDVNIYSDENEDYYLRLGVNDTGSGDFPYIELNRGPNYYTYYNSGDIARRVGTKGYRYIFPEESGTFVVKDKNDNIDVNGSTLTNVYCIQNDVGSIRFGDSGEETEIYSVESALSLSGPNLSDDDSKNKLHYPDIASTPYDWTLPSKSGTIALTKDIVTESRVNELIAAYMSANYDNGDEGSY